MAEKTTLPHFVISDADEGVQINEGTRLGFVGAGFQLEGFADAVEILKKLLNTEIRIVSSGENDWIKQQLDLPEWEQVDAMSQQHIQALADDQELLYAGFMPFADPQDVEHGIKGHMVRPHGVHLANKICFTFGGGEQEYNLGQYLISADWVAQANKKTVKKIMDTQIEFLKKISNTDLKFVCQMDGVLGEKIAKKNKSVMEKLGYNIAEL